MAEVFISYAREDQPFVRRLQTALEARDLSAWVDWEDIPPTAEWMREVETAIEGSESLLFVVSPDSVASPTCRREIDHAATNHKRLVPVVYREVEASLIPESVQAHNWIFCRETDDFDDAVDTIATALRTDLDWVHRHTRLLVRALEWDTKNRDGSFLLRGRDLEDGERWLSEAAQHDTPKATPLQIEYLAASRRGATRSNRVRFGLLSLGLVVAVSLAVVAFLQRDEARHQTTVARARELAASSAAALPNDPELGLWFAVEAERTQSSPLADRALREGLQESRLEKTFTVPGAPKHPRYIVRAVSPDLRLFVATSARESQPVTIRALSTGRIVTTLDVSSKDVSYAQFGANGREVLTDGSAVTLWDARSGRRLSTIDAIGRGSLSSDGSRIVIADPGNTEVFEADGTPVATLRSNDSRAALNRDGTLAVTWSDCEACGEYPVVVWDVASGTAMFQLGNTGANVVAFSPTGDEVVTGDLQGVVRVFDLSKGTSAPAAELHDQTGRIYSVAFSRDGERVVSGSFDDTARVWDPSDGTSFSLRGHAAPVSQALFDNRGSRVATVHDDYKVKIWNTVPFHATEMPSPEDVGTPYAQLDAPGDRSLNYSNFDGSVVVRDIRTGRSALALASRKNRFDAAISGDGHEIVVATPDGRHAKIWDVDSRTARASLQGSGDVYRSPALDARGTRAVTASRRSARIWDAHSGKLEHVLSAPGVTDTAFGPDGQVVALMSKREGSLWNAATGELITRLRGSGDIFRHPRFSPDGTLLATVAGDGTAVHIWDTSSGDARETGFGPSVGSTGDRMVVTTTFSADDRQLMTVYDFGQLRVWDVASGQLLIQPPAEVFSRMNFVLDTAFSPDRTHVTMLSSNAPVYLYDCPLCGSTSSLVAIGDARVSESVKRNALHLSLQ